MLSTVEFGGVSSAEFPPPSELARGCLLARLFMRQSDHKRGQRYTSIHLPNVSKRGVRGGDRWVHQPKLDGWRVQGVKRGSDVALFSRYGRDLTERYPVVAEAVRKVPYASCSLDGELVLATKAGPFAALACARDDGYIPHESELCHGDV